MSNTRRFVRTGAAAAALSLLPSLAHAHTPAATADGFLHDVAHVLFGGQHLFAVPAILVVIGALAFGAIRRLRSSERP